MLFATKNISSGYGSLKVISEISVAVDSNEIVVLLGANGAGKTTFIKSIVSILPIFEGNVFINDLDITHLKTHQKARNGISYMSELGVFPDLKIDENLNMGGYLLPKNKAKKRKKEMYEHFPLLIEKKRDRASSLSGGQRKMLGFAKALMADPKILILDEPSAGLAPLIVDEMIEKLKLFKDDYGVSIFVAEQDIKFMDIADKGYVLDNGHIVGEGDIEGLRENDVVKNAYLGI